MVASAKGMYYARVGGKKVPDGPATPQRVNSGSEAVGTALKIALDIGDNIAFCAPLITRKKHLDEMFGVTAEVVRGLQ